MKAIVTRSHIPDDGDGITSGDEGWHGGVRPYQRLMLLEAPRLLWFDQMDFTVDQIPMEAPTLDKLARRSLRDPIHRDSLIRETEPYTVDGHSALLGTFTESGMIEIYIAREHDGLILRMRTTGNEEEAEKTFYQIVETFSYGENCE